MIPDTMLRSAAQKSCDSYVNKLQEGYDEDEQHVFSLEFEKKIMKLKRKADHPIIYRFVQRAASVLLALLICGCTWLAVDAKARTAVFGWVNEVYESFFLYRHDEKGDSRLESNDYRLGWVPEGYTKSLTDDTEQTIVILYTNEASQMLSFSYIHNPDHTEWLIDSTKLKKSQASVNGLHADLFISNDSEISSAIVWTLPDNTAFCISAFLSEDELIKAAESVEKIKK